MSALAELKPILNVALNPYRQLLPPKPYSCYCGAPSSDLCYCYPDPPTAPDFWTDGKPVSRRGTRQPEKPDPDA